jgi:hypothetical protein
MSLNSYSQNVCLPVDIARQIQQDLIAKDSADSMLVLASEEIMLLGQNIQYKNMLIDTMTSDCLKIRSMMENEKNMKITYKGIAEDCKKEYDAFAAKHKTYKRFIKTVGFIGTAIIAGLTVVILLVK